ncbi:MAG: prepilin peptidase, partial [Candidatus Niameybacter stercoravium]|nr:prepilin peptidase [Candidatus Niameybacter stercoravium]
LGPISILLGTFLGIVLGGIYGVFLLIFRKKGKQDALPFVPFLALGLGIAYLWGEPLISWYLSLF